MKTPGQDTGQLTTSVGRPYRQAGPTIQAAGREDKIEHYLRDIYKVGHHEL